MFLMLLHNLVPHVHHNHTDVVEQEIVHVEHHHSSHSHNHHHESEDNDEEETEHDDILHYLFAHHGHVHFSHERIQLVRVEKQGSHSEKNVLKINFQTFILTPRLVYEIGSPRPPLGLSKHLNPFLRNCSLRAPPSIV